MREEDLAVLAGFDAVWQRVLSGKGQTEQTGAVKWEPLLQGMYDQWKQLDGMARCSRGGERDALAHLSEQARSCFCELQTACFLDTGDVFVTAKTCNFASCTPYNLRKLYQDAVNLARLLQRAKEEGCLPVEDAGKCITDHERVLKELLRECLQ